MAWALLALTMPLAVSGAESSSLFIGSLDSLGGQPGLSLRAELDASSSSDQILVRCTFSTLGMGMFPAPRSIALEAKTLLNDARGRAYRPALVQWLPTYEFQTEQIPLLLAFPRKAAGRMRKDWENSILILRGLEGLGELRIRFHTAPESGPVRGNNRDMGRNRDK